jgi:hypothetical protein
MFSRTPVTLRQQVAPPDAIVEVMPGETARQNFSWRREEPGSVMIRLRAFHGQSNLRIEVTTGSGSVVDSWKISTDELVVAHEIQLPPQSDRPQCVPPENCLLRERTIYFYSTPPVQHARGAQDDGRGIVSVGVEGPGSIEVASGKPDAGPGESGLIVGPRQYPNSMALVIAYRVSFLNYLASYPAIVVRNRPELVSYGVIGIHTIWISALGLAVVLAALVARDRTQHIPNAIARNDERKDGIHNGP